MAKKLSLIAAAAALFAVSACSDIDYNQTAKDAAAGAAVGAGANYLLDQNVAEGALIGAAGGAGISQITN